MDFGSSESATFMGKAEPARRRSIRALNPAGFGLG
jgi:hypothetical protein